MTDRSVAHADTLPYRIVAAAEATDIDSLVPALENTIHNPITGEIHWDEVHGTIQSIKDSVSGKNNRIYGIVESPDGTAVGVMGMYPLTDPTERIYSYVTTERPIEVINAYFDPSVRGKGVGRALLNWLEARARSDDYTEILVTSGPRYQLSGWPFWQRMYGDKIDLAQNYFGGKYYAAVWRRVLEVATDTPD